jgi:hypothetical protein
VVTEDPSYLEGIKIYGIGIKEDPVPGEKRGKGMRFRSHWLDPNATWLGFKGFQSCDNNMCIVNTVATAPGQHSSYSCTEH